MIRAYDATHAGANLRSLQARQDRYLFQFITSILVLNRPDVAIMRFSVFAAALYLAGASALVNPLRRSVTSLDDSYEVPGDNPLLFCQDPSAENYILTIDSVDLDPNPPAAYVDRAPYIAILTFY